MALINDDKVQRQIEHMIAFIEQEAIEKVEEITTKAEEEFNIEKGQIVQQSRVKIIDYYNKKGKQIELNRKIQNSNLYNTARLKILKCREDHIKIILEDTQKRLSSLTSNAAEYKKILKGLIIQGLYQLLEENAELRCRKVDVPLVEEIMQNCIDSYKAATKKLINITINKDNYISDHCVGGVIMLAQGGKIRVENTLESRLDLICEKMLPDLKEMLFGENLNRKFRD